MNNLDFIKTVLMTEESYWVVSRYEDSCNGRTKDTVWFVSMDKDILFDKKYEEITLKDVEVLMRSTVENIPISEQYPPFQRGITMLNIYKGFPVSNKINIKKFLTDCIVRGLNELYECKDLHDSMVQELKNNDSV